MASGWDVMQPTEMDPNTQVVPVADVRRHVVVGTTCWCEPEIAIVRRTDGYAARVVIHDRKGYQRIGGYYGENGTDFQR